MQKKHSPQLIQQIELFTQLLQESPYISREERLAVSKEVDNLSVEILEGKVTLLQGQMQLTQLNKKVAADEIATLISKIRHLNPSSPRLSNLHVLGKELLTDQISPEQARKRLHDFMSFL